jgi:hypothetical protein
MTAAVTHTGAGVSPITPDPGTAQDYTVPVTYTVATADGITQDYTVTVTVAPLVTITGTIADPGVPLLIFSGVPSSPVSAGYPVEITLSGSVTVASWYVEITGPGSFTGTPIPPDKYTFTVPAGSSGFYSVNVIVTMDYVDYYSGSFALTVN